MSAVFAAVAALAALAAIYYARETVTQARKANREAAKANAEEAAAHLKQLAAMKEATDATIAATEAAADQHKATLAAELSLRRMEQIERISELLLTVADVARDETSNPPEKLSPGVAGSRLPVLHRHFGNAVRILELITGVSELPKTAALARAGYTGVAWNSLDGAVAALLEIDGLLQKDDEMDAVRFLLN